MYRRFYIEYFSNGIIHRQRIRRWANENRQIFPEYGFTNSTSDYPITHLIAYRLESQFGFDAIQVGNEVTLMCHERGFIGFGS